MRAFHRKAAVVSASAWLIFFCSCERHKPDELAYEEPAVADSTDRHHSAGDLKHEHEGDKENAAHSRTTPAQFFPSATPR